MKTSESISLGCARTSRPGGSGAARGSTSATPKPHGTRERSSRTIAAQVNPRRIYQWGSLLDRRRFSEISDLDIAVEGLSGPAEYFEVLGIAMNATALPVDVVELEKLPVDVADRIRRRGVLVHERTDP